MPYQQRGNQVESELHDMKHLTDRVNKLEKQMEELNEDMIMILERLEQMLLNIKKKKDGMEYKIVRTYSAGVFAGEVESREGKEVVLKNARRLWFWEGAASLSQLAMEGTSKPDECKFPIAVDKVVLTEAIEILDVTTKARESIEGVPIWQQ